jgi:hypothetical protein
MLSKCPSVSAMCTDRAKLSSFAEEKGYALEHVQQVLGEIQSGAPFVPTQDFCTFVEFIEFCISGPAPKARHVWIGLSRDVVSASNTGVADKGFSVPVVKAIQSAFGTGLFTTKKAFDSMWETDCYFSGSLTENAISNLRAAGLTVVESAPGGKQVSRLLALNKLST